MHLLKDFDMRTRSSRRLEGKADAEQLPDVTKICTTRKGRKKAARNAAAEQEFELGPASNPVVPEYLPAIPHSEAQGSIHEQKIVIPPHEGEGHQASAGQEKTEHSKDNLQAELDFSVEATRLAEAVLQASEDEEVGRGRPTSAEDQQQRSMSQDAPAQEPICMPADINAEGQLSGHCTASHNHGDFGISVRHTEPPTVSEDAPSHEDINDCQTDQLIAQPADRRHTSDSHAEVPISTAMGPPEAASTEALPRENTLHPQPAAEAGSEEVPHRAGDSTACEDSAVLEPKPQQAPGRELHVRRSMRSGSLEAYERGVSLFCLYVSHEYRIVAMN